jgi:[protein-PII] uridylyltransferase
MPSPAFLRAFSESMPRAYRRAHSADSIANHARVAEARGGRRVNVGLFPPARGAQAGLCVIADDRPGLLATLSAALVLHGLDVIDAEAHTRRTPEGGAEAVDIFWVRRARPEERARPITDADAEAVREVIDGLLEGKVDASTLGGPSPQRPATETVVRFIESEAGALATLEVETDDRSGLLLALARALFEQRVQIVESEVKTLGSRVSDRFRIVELDGRPIGDARRLEIQVAVLSAVQPGASTG